MGREMLGIPKLRYSLNGPWRTSVRGGDIEELDRQLSRNTRLTG